MTTVGIAKNIVKPLEVLPQFVLENHQRFKKFIEAYYEWSASEGPDLAFESLKFNNDIDLVLEDLLFVYRGLVARDFPVKTASNFRHFVKFVKEFYQVKGSPESFEFFFRAVFNEKVEIYFPRAQLFKPSQGHWETRNIALVSIKKGNIKDITGTEYVGNQSGAIIQLSSAFVLDNHILVLVDYSDREPIIGETLISDGSELEILPLTTIVSFVSDTGYSTGDLLYDPLVGVFKVNQIVLGKVVGVDVVNGGEDYKVGDKVTAAFEGNGGGFKAVVSSVGPDGEILSVTVLDKGFGYDTDYYTVSIDSEEGSGAELELVFNDDFTKIKHLQLITPTPFDQSSVSIGGTDITLDETPLFKLNYYYDNKSMLSGDHIKLHDSDYFQEFSYTVESRADYSDVKNSVEKLLHVAGLKMFPKHLIEFNLSEPTESTFLFLD
jgi:hypothetical protein